MLFYLRVLFLLNNGSYQGLSFPLYCLRKFFYSAWLRYQSFRKREFRNDLFFTYENHSVLHFGGPFYYQCKYFRFHPMFKVYRFLESLRMAHSAGVFLDPSKVSHSERCYATLNFITISKDFPVTRRRRVIFLIKLPPPTLATNKIMNLFCFTLPF